MQKEAQTCSWTRWLEEACATLARQNLGDTQVSNVASITNWRWDLKPDVLDLKGNGEKESAWAIGVKSGQLPGNSYPSIKYFSLASTRCQIKFCQMAWKRTQTRT